MRLMNALLERSDTIVPSERDAELAATASRALAHSITQNLRVSLEDGSELALPKAVTRLLSHLLMEMGRGNAVTIFPIHAELTTQQAADFLNVSRPYLIGLLESGSLAYHKVGTHRRIKFTDLTAFKKFREDKRQGALEELAGQAQSMGMGY